MEQVRLLVAIALSFLVFFGWNFFFVEKEAQPPQSGQSAQTDTGIKPVETASSVPAVIPSASMPAEVHPPKVITVKTPLYTVEISEKGAAFKSFILKKYREHVDADSPLKQLIPKDIYAGTLYAGFTGAGLPDLKNVTFSTNAESDTVDVSYGKKEIFFSWVSPQGILFEKRFSFSPDTYLIGLNIYMKNQSGQPINGNMTLTLADHTPSKDSQYGFEGPSALIDNSLEQIKLKKIKDKNIYNGKVKWIAIESRYFMSGIIPKQALDSKMYLVVTSDDILENQYVGPDKTIMPGDMTNMEFDVFFGPKSLKLLKSFNNGLNKLINFGMFDFIAKPCLWLMNLIHDYIPNYGLAIIILTIFIKILLWPLGNKSYKSMNDMKRIQPLMAEIREKYKSDKQKMNQELMGLYKIYKINPMGGCLPMILQIPVFFAFYRMLYEAIELRHAPFFGWMNDLSAPDRLFHFNFSIPFMEPPYGIPVLTIIMGATMLLQQKMAPPPGDPAQAKMMMFMPVIFTFIFINFSSGLVLYWLINNILSIAQQYYILKKNA